VRVESGGRPCCGSRSSESPPPKPENPNRRGNRPCLTDAQLRELARQYEHGTMVKNMARKRGVSESAVRHGWRRIGIKPKRPRGTKAALTRAQVIEAVRLVEQDGLTVEAVARRFHVGYVTLLDSFFVFDVLPPLGRHCPRCRFIAKHGDDATSTGRAGTGESPASGAGTGRGDRHR
jgi:hypothetical protein